MRFELTMPYELLERLRCTKLPIKIDDQDEIDKLLTLRTEGLIDADIPLSQERRGHHSWCGSAIVMQVTPRGQLVLKGRSAGLPSTGVHGALLV